jgi:hypothetical protein
MTANTVTVNLPDTDPSKTLLADLNGPTTIEQLLGRAERNGTKRARTVAARIRHDANLLEKLLAEHGEEAAARKKVEKLRAQLAAAEAELREKTGAQRNIARLAGPNQPAPSATTAVMRAWLIENGHPVSEYGRLCNGDIRAYEAAHQGGE